MIRQLDLFFKSKNDIILRYDVRHLKTNELFIFKDIHYFVLFRGKSKENKDKKLSIRT